MSAINPVLPQQASPRFGALQQAATPAQALPAAMPDTVHFGGLLNADTGVLYDGKMDRYTLKGELNADEIRIPETARSVKIPRDSKITGTLKTTGETEVFIEEGAVAENIEASGKVTVSGKANNITANGVVIRGEANDVVTSGEFNPIMGKTGSVTVKGDDGAVMLYNSTEIDKLSFEQPGGTVVFYGQDFQNIPLLDTSALEGENLSFLLEHEFEGKRQEKRMAVARAADAAREALGPEDEAIRLQLP